MPDFWFTVNHRDTESSLPLLENLFILSYVTLLIACTLITRAILCVGLVSSQALCAGKDSFVCLFNPEDKIQM